MNHVLLTLKWKDIMYHKGSIFNMKSIIADGLVPGGKRIKQNCFSPLDPFESDDEDEDYHDHMKIPRNVHYCSKWKNDQDAFFLVDAQELGL